MAQSLEQAVKYLDDSAELTKKVKAILMPNIIQFGGIFVMLILGTLIAIPAIQGVFDQVGSKEELPAITLWFADFLDFVISIWYIPAIIVVGAVTSVISYIRTPKGRYNFDLFKYKMPIFGTLIYALDFERILKAMLLNLRNGIRIQDSLEVSKNITKNYVMLSIIETSINNIIIRTKLDRTV